MKRNYMGIWALQAVVAILLCSGLAQATTEPQKITASDAAANDFFGFTVSVDGDTSFVGAWADAGKGSAYVFTSSTGVWGEQQKLTAGDAAPDDRFGFSVSVSGNTAIIGAFRDDDGGSNSGSAYVFTRSGGVWTQQQKLTASDTAVNDFFGYSVSVSGNTALIGAWADDDVGNASGSAYVFTRSGGTWTEQQKLTASDAAADDYFGQSVSVSGDTAVAGAYRNGANAPGSAYVFVRSGGVWSLQQKLTASDPHNGKHFGFDVSVSGSTLLVGASEDNEGGNGAGGAYVFTRSGGVWSQQQKLTASDAAAGDSFGYSVWVSGDKAIAGAFRDDDGGDSSGSGYVFTRSGGVWTEQQKLTASDAASADRFGWSVSLSGDAALVGAYLDDDAGNAAGSVYVFGVDFTPPITTTITPATVGPSNLDAVDFTVTFDEDVQDFDDASDIVVTHSGTASTGLSITGGPSVYTVSVTGITGDGSFTLAVDTGSDVQDLAGNALASSVTSAAVSIDNTAVVFSNLVATPAGARADEMVTITFDASEPTAGDPAVTVNGHPTVRTAKAAYAFEFIVPPSEALGPATIDISGIDAAGNMGTLVNSTALTILAPVAAVPLAAWPVGIVLLGLGALALRRRK